MKKTYETPNVVITVFDSVDTTSVNVRSVAAPTSANKMNITKTQTLN